MTNEEREDLQAAQALAEKRVAVYRTIHEIDQCKEFIRERDCVEELTTLKDAIEQYLEVAHQ